jgi:hypothetical protein
MAILRSPYAATDRDGLRPHLERNSSDVLAGNCRFDQLDEPDDQCLGEQGERDAVIPVVTTTSKRRRSER